MIPAEEFLCGNGASLIRAAPVAPDRRWLRNVAQWTYVIAAHAAVVWFVLHVSPGARQAVGEIIQATLIAPQVQPAPMPPPPEPQRPMPKVVPRIQPPRPAPLLAATPHADASAAAFVVDSPPAEPAPVAALAAPAAAVVSAPPLVLPLFNADYLDNPQPIYPAMSRRQGETGRVLLRVYVSADGKAERVELKTSSGFERLDQSAREAVTRWRFVPARRGSEQVAAWVLVPISFVM
jgi:protein TonB